MAITLRLRDRNQAMATAWQAAFAGLADVEIGTGDIFDVSADAIVSPANSFGFMDGGIDAAYTERFGQGLQERLQKLLRERFFGELPVGQAVVVETQDAEIPFCISAPTMRVPMDVSETVNAYLAFRAALRAAIEHGGIRSVLCPGMGTAVGKMSPARSARQMASAYANVVLGRVWDPPTLGHVLDEHFRLLK